MSETARHLNEAADLIDEGESAHFALIRTTGNESLPYTLAIRAFREHGQGAPPPANYAAQFGPALTAHRMREVARALQNA